MSHRLPCVVACCPLGGNIIGTVWNKDSVDPCTLDDHAIWTSLCSCDDVTSGIGCTCVASVVYGSGASGIVDGASVARVSGCVVGCTSVTCVVYGTSAARVSGCIVGCTGITSIVDGAGGTSSVSVSGSVVSGV